MTSTKVVLITNDHDNGIGQAAAVEFSRLGYRVAITGGTETNLDHIIKNIVEASPDSKAFGDEENHLTLNVNFRDECQVDRIIPTVVAKYGQLDIIVNNLDHGGRSVGLLDEIFFEHLNSTLKVNLYAPTRLAQLAAPYLLKSQHGGIIINVVSGSDQIPPSRQVVRTGLKMLSKTLANSFENQNVRCLTISSSPEIRTASKPVGHQDEEVAHHRVNSPEDIANIIVFMASDKARYINGTTIEVVDG